MQVEELEKTIAKLKTELEVILNPILLERET